MSLRIPSCFQREIYEMAQGRRFWQAADLRVPTLLIRGERDFWSRSTDDEVMARITCSTIDPSAAAAS